MKTSKFNILIASAVSLGGFLFGFDAAVISGVTSFIVPEFGLNDIQLGWAVASLTFAASLAMISSGPLSDVFGRRKILLFVGLLYSVSALGSAFAPTYSVLVVARMIGGLAVGAALILAPMYIAETSPPANRGKMVSIQQLMIVLGFSAAYFSNYYLLGVSGSGASWVANLGIDEHVWRWMLGIEAIPAILFFFAMFFVPESPRWLLMKGKSEEAKDVLIKIHGEELAAHEHDDIQTSLNKVDKKTPISALFKPALRLVITIGLIVGVLQQITGVNAIYFYATAIFEQSGVGKNAAFAQAVWIGIINVVFTLVAMALIDRIGRKPLLLIGIAGVAVSMFLTAWGFNQATYSVTPEAITAMNNTELEEKLAPLVNSAYDNDLEFKNAMKETLGMSLYAANEGELIKQCVSMNPIIILIGILGFVASFAVSLGPVMWVLLSELFPNWVRGVAISFVGFVNSAVSFGVQLVFPWELSNLGNAMSYALFGVFGLLGFVLLLKYLPETKGKSLEEIESELVAG